VRFLIDASLPRATAQVVRARGHDAIDVRDIGLGSGSDEDIAAHAQSQQLALLSRDFDFSDIRNYPPEDYPGIAVFELPNHATIPVIASLVDAFLQQPIVLTNLPGRLAIVEPGRVRLRPAP
jgi:predicted nuclease of predicted toxin-antitoxin system